MPAKLILSSPEPLLHYELQPGINRAGRNPMNELRLSDPSVSSFHCEITLENGTVWINDLGSTNGTFINGQAVGQSVLQPGQTLQIGLLKLHFSQEEEVQVRIPKMTAPATPTPPVINGVPACANHHSLPAAYRCGKCQGTFCEACVRSLGRSTGERMIFCRVCDGQCSPLSPERPASATGPATPQSQSFLGRLTQTLRIPWTGRR
jgi:hypothetical protein